MYGMFKGIFLPVLTFLQIRKTEGGGSENAYTYSFIKIFNGILRGQIIRKFFLYSGKFHYIG